MTELNLMLRNRLAALRPPAYSAAGVEQALATKYMADHCVADLLRDVLNDLVLLQPPDALQFLHDRLGQVGGRECGVKKILTFVGST